MALEIWISRDDRIRYHTRPQYSLVVILSQLGGTLGLCFGVSIMSLAQVLCLCGRLAKAVATKRASRADVVHDGGP